MSDSSPGQNRGGNEGWWAKQKGKAGPKKGRPLPEDSFGSQADECSHAEEIVGHDEGTVGGAESQGVGPDLPWVFKSAHESSAVSS